MAGHLVRKEFYEYLNCVGGFREFMPNLKGWKDDEIWDMLPAQDARYRKGQDGIGDMLLEIPYREIDTKDLKC